MALLIIISCEKSPIQVKEYYDDGTEKMIYEISNGLKNGKMVEYYPSGKIKSQSNWINDTITGLEIKYYETGLVESTTMRLNGRLNGYFVKFDEEGFVNQTRNYSFSQPVGYDMRFYEGILFSTLHFVLIGDSSILNQVVYFDRAGNISDNFSSFFSIYYPNNSDTIHFYEKPEIIVILETPFFIDGKLNVRAAPRYSNIFYSNINIINMRLDTINDIFVNYPWFFDWPGENNISVYIINQYLDENGIKRDKKFYFRKRFYIVE